MPKTAEQRIGAAQKNRAQCASDCRSPVRSISASAFTIPTDSPESDGTYKWNKTTLVVVKTEAEGTAGLGYTYADVATARLIADALSQVVRGRNVMDIPGAWDAMVRTVRNVGRPGIASMAIAAVDASLWDLKARLLDLPLVKLLGAARESVSVYGSGGFTSYSIEQLQKQLAGWAEAGIPRVKMKIGTHPEEDVRRVRAAREAIGPEVELFVDANGAYGRQQALSFANAFADLGVTWFEEPVSSDDLDGLRFIRERAPASVEIAAGEYGYDLWYFRRMLEAEGVDVLQADATRCAGITGFMQAASLCQAHFRDLSAHCGPSLHVHACCSALPVRHLEYFHDHVRIEHMLFDGALTPTGGKLRPDLTRPGLGLDFKHDDADQFRVWKGGD